MALWDDRRVLVLSICWLQGVNTHNKGVFLHTKVMSLSMEYMCAWSQLSGKVHPWHHAHHGLNTDQLNSKRRIFLHCHILENVSMSKETGYWKSNWKLDMFSSWQYQTISNSQLFSLIVKVKYRGKPLSYPVAMRSQSQNENSL